MAVSVVNDPMRGRVVISNTVSNALDTGGITSVVIRRKQHDASTWITISTIVIRNEAGLDFVVSDIYARPHVTYDYAVDMMSGETQVSTEVFTVEVTFDGIMIGTEERQYSCILNPKVEYTLHYNMDYIQPLFSKYPKSIQNGNMCYSTGSVQGLFIPMTNNGLTLEDEYAYKRELLQFLANGKKKLLKTYDGHMWMVQIDKDPQEVINEYEQASEIKFSWTEVADIPTVGIANNYLDDMGLILQPTIRTAIRINTLDANYNIIGELQGGLVDISSNIKADSDIRNTCNLTMVVNEGQDFANTLPSIWMDKLARVFFGIWDEIREQYVWYIQGTYLYTQNSCTYDQATRQLTLTLSDIMASVTSIRGSMIGHEVEIEAESNMKEAIETTIERFSPYKDNIVCDFDDTVPYDLEFNHTDYPYVILKQLVDLYPCHEQFYNRSGVYIVKSIPTAMAEPCVLSAEEMKEFILGNETVNTDFSEVKNATEIWGQELDAEFTAETCTTTDNCYTLSVVCDTYQLKENNNRVVVDDEYEILTDGDTFAFVPMTDCADGQTMRILSLPVCGLYTQNGLGEYTPIEANEILAGVQYVVRYVGADERFVLLGRSLIHVMCMEYNNLPSDETIMEMKAFHDCEDMKFIINPDSPYSCERIGCVKNVLRDGEFANITSTNLAFERASYENWKSTRFYDTITLECLYVPWLDVNQKIEYTSLNTGETHQYIVQEIDVKSNFTMTLTLRKFYNFYPWLKGFCITYGDMEDFRHSELMQYTHNELGG